MSKGLSIVGNEQLTNASGLANLFVGGSIVVTGAGSTQGLVDTAAAYVPSTLGLFWQVAFIDNPQLDGPLGVEGLTGTLPLDLVVRGNGALSAVSFPDVVALELTYSAMYSYPLFGSVRVENNTALTAASFASLVTLEDCTFSDNPSLRNITMPSLTDISGSLTLLRNPLVDCGFVAYILSPQVSLWGVLYFDGDCTGAPTPSECLAPPTLSLPLASLPQHSPCNVTLGATSSVTTALNSLFAASTVPGAPLTVCLSAGLFEGEV